MMTLLNPPNPPNAVSNKDTMGGLGQLYAYGTNVKMPPLDIAYIAAVMRREAIPFEVIECLGLDMELSDLILRIREIGPEFIAIRTSTPSLEWDLRIAQILNMISHAKIIFFGPHVTLFPDQVINKPFIDAVVVGDPEAILPTIAKKREFSACEGIAYKEDGKVISRSPGKWIDTLDALPFPAWDMLPYQAYEAGTMMRNIKPFVTFLASRGCPHGCIYCPYPVTQGRKLRQRSPENIINELAWIQSELNVKAVLFRDPEFAINRERIVAICEGIVRHKIKLAWRCETRIENLSEEIIALMAHAGCIGINMGVESTDESVLRTMNRKPILFSKASRIVNLCEKYGIDVFCFFIIGLPGETKRTALKTINYAVKLNPPFLQFTVATPYPGTELRRWAEQKKFIENESLSSLTGYEAVMRNEYLTADQIQRLRAYAQTAWEMKKLGALKNVIMLAGNVWEYLKKWVSFKMQKYKF